MRSGPRARDDGFPPPPPELTGKPGLCASSAHPSFLQQSLSTCWAPPCPSTGSTQQRPWGWGPRLVCPELLRDSQP